MCEFWEDVAITLEMSEGKKEHLVNLCLSQGGEKQVDVSGYTHEEGRVLPELSYF